MSRKYVITANNNPQKFRDVVFKDGAYSYEFDLSPWAEDNNDLTDITWTVESGQAAISNQTISSNVISALLSFSEQGGNLVKIKCDTGSEIYIIWMDVLAKDPQLPTDDYGYWC